ncbi:MAG: hypothetical protein ABL994_01390 [Verrucomicrobiales bacterium]
MRKGLRFQSKLMLTLVAAIATVTAALIAVTEAQVKGAYTRQFSRDFKHLVNQLERSRLERSEEFMELCRHLAGQPFIVSSLSGEASQEEEYGFWRYYKRSLFDLGDSLEKRPDALVRKTAPSPDVLSRIGSVGIVKPSGEIISLPHPIIKTTSKDGDKRRIAENRLRQGVNAVNRAKERIEELLASERQQTFYLPFESPDGTGYVQEMVSTPVKRPGSDETIGLFLRATSAETDAQRFLERYQEEFDSDAPLLSGIYLDGQVYSRNLEPELAELMAGVLGKKIPEKGTASERETIQFDATIRESPYRIYLARLTDESSHAPAYQVSAFSLETLKSDLAELRIRGDSWTGARLSALP